jgi:Putative endonuclease, protein of unknown function (DUF1780)
LEALVASVKTSSNAHDQARRRYQPKDLKLLFVAEAPPSDLERFFYFEAITKHDWLFLALVRWLYDEARELPTPELRKRKREFLDRFAADGYFLLDASDSPMPPGATSAEKRRLLSHSLPTFIEKIARVNCDNLKIVLISHAVYEVCCAPLRTAGFNVLNNEMIDFPSSGRQAEFRRKLGQLLDENLRNAVQELEESVRWWSPGQENQKARERYVAEHFLQGLGIEFNATDLIQPESDPPDVIFRGAAFEIKEVQTLGRKRHDEYRERLARARAAERFGDLIEPYSSDAVPIAAVIERLMAESKKLAVGKYPPQLRRSLDLLFYVNFGIDHWGAIEDGPRPDLQTLRDDGWRSVSFLQGASACCVLTACENAPEYLRLHEGKLIHCATGA